MVEANNDGKSRKMVYFCVNGHNFVQEEGRIIRKKCPICLSAIDRNRPPLPYEEYERSLNSQAKQNEETHEETHEDEQQENTDFEDKRLYNTGSQNTGRVVPEKEITVKGQNSPGKSAVWRLPKPSMPGKRVLDKDKTNSAPLRENRNVRPSAQTHFDVETERSVSGFGLEYFGDIVSIPQEGAWIGREGLGRQWFDGNLMISRKHVFVHPDIRSNRLQINQDKSLNGVFYTGPNREKIRLEGARMMEPGDILWIYNIPLRITKK